MNSANMGPWPVTIGMADARAQVLRRQVDMAGRTGMDAGRLERELDALYGMYPSIGPSNPKEGETP